MEILKSPLWWAIALALAVAFFAIARKRATEARVEAGSTLTPDAAEAGSWDLTAALPPCPQCHEPMTLRDAKRGPQRWACATPGCKGPG